MNALSGLKVILGDDYELNIDDLDESIVDDVADATDGFYDAVNEVMGEEPKKKSGFDMNQVTPYLSAVTQGLAQAFGGADPAAAAKAAEDAKKQAEQDKQDAARKAANSKTTMWVLLGLGGAAVLGIGGYYMTKKS